jgi:hypothetical protein
MSNTAAAELPDTPMDTAGTMPVTEIDSDTAFGVYVEAGTALTHNRKRTKDHSDRINPPWQALAVQAKPGLHTQV